MDNKQIYENKCTHFHGSVCQSGGPFSGKLLDKENGNNIQMVPKQGKNVPF